MVYSVAVAQPKREGREEQQHLAALIGRIAQSDQAAVAELYDATSPSIFGLALVILGDRAAAEEVTLDVYAQVWRAAASYNPERGAPSTWLFMLTRSRGIDYLRSRAWREHEREQPLDLVGAYADSAPGPEEEIATAGRSHIVRTVLAELAPEQRDAIELAFYSGLSHREIAARLGQPLGTVKTRIRLGMLRLRDLLQPYTDRL